MTAFFSENGTQSKKGADERQRGILDWILGHQKGHQWKN